jgi:transposase-like protein
MEACLLDTPAAEPAIRAETRLVPGVAAEPELLFYARRAWEESRLAAKAATPKAAAAHSYLAAAYSAEVAKELAKKAEMDELLLRLP